MELSYRVQRSAGRKTLTITVERNGGVVVHAPADASDETIQRVVQSRRQWIFEKRRHDKKYRELPHPPGKELVSGESALYLGRLYRIEILANGGPEIQFTQRFLVPAALTRRRKQAMRDWYVARAHEIILPRVSRRATVLGVQFRRASIVDSRFRWGSCTVGHNVTFNWRLIRAPMFVIDYVIVHELSHLVETNHTPRFWNVVRAQAPTMEKARTWLKENGQILEEDV